LPAFDERLPFVGIGKVVEVGVDEGAQLGAVVCGERFQ
jgi:hypothetical protein